MLIIINYFNSHSSVSSAVAAPAGTAAANVAAASARPAWKPPTPQQRQRRGGSPGGETAVASPAAGVTGQRLCVVVDRSGSDRSPAGGRCRQQHGPGRIVRRNGLVGERRLAAHDLGVDSSWNDNDPELEMALADLTTAGSGIGAMPGRMICLDYLT